NTNNTLGLGATHYFNVCALPGNHDAEWGVGALPLELVSERACGVVLHESSISRDRRTCRILSTKRNRAVRQSTWLHWLWLLLSGVDTAVAQTCRCHCWRLRGHRASGSDGAWSYCFQYEGVHCGLTRTAPGRLDRSRRAYRDSWV